MITAENPDFTVPVASTGDGDIREITNVPADDAAFKDLKLLGMGGMGIVYEAEDPALERKVALKMLRSPYRNDGDLVKKFINEARITAKIDHPNIIAVHHLGMNKDCGAYFSMRRIKGETLQSIIRKLRSRDPEYIRKYPLRRLLDIFIAGCNGVDAAHLQNILHCDLKPSNIMVGDRGEVWVLDWGVARTADSPAPDNPNMIEGTVAFMAPELLRGTLAAPDKKTDIYSLGVLLYCILTWQDAPYDLNLEHQELVNRVASGKYRPLNNPDKSRKLPVELVAICKKAMTADRERRYDTIPALRADIYHYLDNKPVGAYSPNPLYRFFKLCCRRPLIPVTATVALLTMAAYHAGTDFIQYAENRSLTGQAFAHTQIANDHIRTGMHRWQQLTSPDSSSSPLDTALTEHEMKLSTNYAVLETFFAFDAISGTSENISYSFAASYGKNILKRLLRLQCITSAPDILEQIEKRWPQFFQICMKNDPELQKLVDRIKKNCGTVTFSGINSDTPHNCTVIRPDGSSKSISFKNNFTLELPAGNNRFFIAAPGQKTFSALLQITPGMNLRFSAADFPPPPGFILIPDDHWFITVPGLGQRLKRLSKYMISAAELTGGEVMNTAPECQGHAVISLRGKALLPLADAELFCRAASKKYGSTVRFPNELELQKSLSAGELPGKSFYGAELPSADIPLFVKTLNGKTALFNAQTMKIEPFTPGRTAALRPVIELK